MRRPPTCRHVWRGINGNGALAGCEHLPGMHHFLRSASPWHATTVLALIYTLAFAPGLRAQSDRLSVPLGTRVRIVVDVNEPFTGNLLRLSPDTLVVAVGSGGALIQVPTSRVSSIELSGGRDRLSGSLKGAGIGLLAGGLIGGVAIGRSDGNNIAALAGLFAGGIIGVGAGAIVGAIVAPERWRWLSLPGKSK